MVDMPPAEATMDLFMFGTHEPTLLYILFEDIEMLSLPSLSVKAPHIISYLAVLSTALSKSGVLTIWPTWKLYSDIKTKLHLLILYNENALSLLDSIGLSGFGKFQNNRSWFIMDLLPLSILLLFLLITLLFLVLKMD